MEQISEVIFEYGVGTKNKILAFKLIDFEFLIL